MKMITIPARSSVRLKTFGHVGVAVLFSTSLCSVAQPRATRLQTVRSASVDANGRVHVVSGNGREMVVTKEIGQESVEPPVVAADHRTVGWLVNFSNCCTSYPIPMSIVLYRDGHILHRIGNGMGIFRWQFLRDGEQIAYFSDTVHSNLNPVCTLVDVMSGRTLQKWSRGDGTLPSWAEAFADDVGGTESTP